MTDEPSQTDSRPPGPSSADHEIPLKTPPLDGLLPEPSAPKKPRRPLGKPVKLLGLVVLGTAALLGLFLVLPTGEPAEPPSGALVQLVEPGAVWRYLDDGSNPGDDWMQPGFDDSAWPADHGLFGYGRGDETTVLRCRVGWPKGEPCPEGGEPNRILTHYFRHAFHVEDPERFARARISLLKDDGAVVYLNGEPIIRTNMAAGVVGWNQPAAHEIESGRSWFDYELDLRKTVPGKNVLAVEVHQAAPDGDDLAFDLSLPAFDLSAHAVARGPYLQTPTPSSIIVRWRTPDRMSSVVRWGTSAEELDRIATDSRLTTAHRVEIEGLEPATTYHYRLGSSEQRLSTRRTYTFTTPPASGDDVPVRIWAVGDQGTGDSLARKVKLAALRHAGAQPPDVWITLGDNAYDDGTDPEFQRALFGIYGELLHGLPLWPSTGNHDLKSVKDGKGPYYEIFDLPTHGEAGGVASGTEAYYSFDHGPIHFVVLDTTLGDLRPGREMLTWLEEDLEASSQPWTIAYFHHPPYTDGWHQSDDPKKGWRMTAVRENVLPLLEAAGVDLVLAGHSHSYERSYLLSGHYDTSDTLTETMKMDAGDGRPDGDGAYAKRRGGRGTVYVVAGSSGKLAEGRLEHPAMVVSLQRLGSLLIDVDGRVLDLSFVMDDGEIGDRFRLVHR